MAEQTDPPAATTTAVHDALTSGSVAAPKTVHVLVQNPVLLANVLAFLGSKYTFGLGASRCGKEDGIKENAVVHAMWASP